MDISIYLNLHFKIFYNKRVKFINKYCFVKIIYKLLLIMNNNIFSKPIFYLYKMIIIFIKNNFIRYLVYNC